MKNDVCFGCKALQSELDVLSKKCSSQGKKITWLETMLALAMQNAIDLGQRLKIRVPDSEDGWPGDRSALLELERLQAKIYRKEMNCEEN